jgi:hypothetical protein
MPKFKVGDRVERIGWLVPEYMRKGTVRSISMPTGIALSEVRNTPERRTATRIAPSMSGRRFQKAEIIALSFALRALHGTPNLSY